MSKFNYCPVTRHFCTQSSINKMEKIQERALRFICDDFESPLPDLLRLNNASILHINRMELMAREVFKTVHAKSPFYLHDLMNIKILNYNFRRENRLVYPKLMQPGTA